MIFIAAAHGGLGAMISRKLTVPGSPGQCSDVTCHLDMNPAGGVDKRGRQRPSNDSIMWVDVTMD